MWHFLHMPTTTQFCTMQMGINPLLGGCDLVIVPSGNGRGRIAVDRTPASCLLIALATDRRAEPDDIVPEMQTAPAGTPQPLFARRGYVGDILLPEGQRLGTRLWLYERAKCSEDTRQAVIDAVLEGVAVIADYHSIDIDVAAVWGSQRGMLLTSVSALGQSISAQVQTL